MSNDKGVHFSLRIPGTVLSAVMRDSLQLDRSIAWVVNKAIEEYLDRRGNPRVGKEGASDGGALQ